MKSFLEVVKSSGLFDPNKTISYEKEYNLHLHDIREYCVFESLDIQKQLYPDNDW